MTCLTCETTPPPEKTGDRVGPHHIGERFGDGGLGLAVLFRGQDWTLQTVEAMAGDEDTGWAEVRIVNSDGTPTIHPPAPWTCASCAEPTEPAEYGDFLDADGMPERARWSPCGNCGNDDEPIPPAHPAHVVTVLRRGMVQIIRGTEVISGPPEPRTEITALGETTPSYLPTG